MSDEDLLSQLDRPAARGWRPDEGDVLIGNVVSLTWREARPDAEVERYPILTVRKDDGEEVAVHAFHKVLRNELLDARPAVGARIAIKYEGMAEGGDYSYANYRVAIERTAGTELAWGDSGPPPEEPEPDLATTPQRSSDDDIPF